MFETVIYGLMPGTMILSVGYILAMYLSYNIKISSKLVLDFIIIWLMMIALVSRDGYIVLDLFFYVIVGYALLVVHHKKNHYGSMLISLVVVLMVLLNHTLGFILFVSDPCFLASFETGHVAICSTGHVIVHGIIILIIYGLIGWLVGRNIDTKNRRSRTTYLVFTLFYIFVLMTMGYVIDEIINTLQPLMNKEHLLFYIIFLYFPVFNIVVFTCYYLSRLIRAEKTIKEGEDALLLAEQKRREGYRANHNFDNIVLTIHTLAKQEHYDELKEYIERLS